MTFSTYDRGNCEFCNREKGEMISKEKIAQVIFSAIDEINLLLPKNQLLKKSMNVVLSGGLGELDSLGLISLIVAIEQKVEGELGVSITLTDERAMSEKDSPFRTVKTLVDYVSLLLKENANG